MSDINRAFALAAQYRQQAIDQNTQAAMMGPALTIQALQAGLQAQVQSQQMQMQMQGQVLDAQLRIKEMESKQQMQLLEFDMAQRKLAADMKMNQDTHELNKKRVDSAVKANDLQMRVDQFKMDEMDLEQKAEVFFTGVMSNNGLTQEEVVIDPQGLVAKDLEALSTQDPKLHAKVFRRVSDARDKLTVQLSTELAAGQKNLFDALQAGRLSSLEKSAIIQSAAPALQVTENKLAQLQRRAPRDVSYRGVANALQTMPAGVQMDPESAVKLMGAIQARMDGLDPKDPQYKATMDNLTARMNSLLDQQVPVPGGVATGTRKPAGPEEVDAALPVMDISKFNPARRQAMVADANREKAVAEAGLAMGSVHTALYEANLKAEAAGDMAKSARLIKLARIANLVDEAAQTGGRVPLTETRAVVGTGAGGNIAMTTGYYGTPTPGEVRDIKRAADARDVDKVEMLLKKLEVPL